MLKKEIERLYEDFVEREGLNISLNFIMPKGYENAFGTFDVCKNTLFLNQNLMTEGKKVRMLFTLYHELYHAKQYLHREKFDEKVKKSIDYVVLYDGSAFKLCEGEWKEGRLINCEFEFVEVYKNLPYEIQANEFAYDKVKQMVSQKDKSELERIYIQSKPTIEIPYEKMQKIFEQIDKIV